MIVDRKVLSDRMLPALRRAAVLALAVGASTSIGAESVGVLHDTGQTTCFAPDYSAVPCEEATTGDGSALPRQDARFGRDALAAMGRLPKIGMGEYGFDYTRICMSGEVEGDGACPFNPPVPADLDQPAPNDWGCLRDNVTGLVWSLGSSVLLSWADASSTAPGRPIYRANTSARCGLNSGWRLPERREGFSLMSFGRQVPALEPAYFPFMASDYFGGYWTTDVYARNPNLNWTLEFVWAGAYTTWCRENVPGDSLCESSPAPNGRFDARVLLVNGAWRSASPSASGPRWQIRDDGLVVTDAATGLMWDRCTWGQTGSECDGEGRIIHHWHDAIQVPQYANQMRYRGYEDWRVPNVRELETLVKIDAAFPSIDTTVFPNTAQELYWTSTQQRQIPTVSNTAYCVGFRDGVVGTCVKEVDVGFTPNRSPVRLVRGGSPYGMVDGISERMIRADFDPAPPR